MIPWFERKSHGLTESLRSREFCFQGFFFGETTDAENTEPNNVTFGVDSLH